MFGLGSAAAVADDGDDDEVGWGEQAFLLIKLMSRRFLINWIKSPQVQSHGDLENIYYIL